MKIISEGIAVFEGVFLRNDEVIEASENSPTWRQGTIGQIVDPKVRMTDVHDLDSHTELHKEILDAFISAVKKYSQKYTFCRISNVEALKVGRYSVGGHYALHADAKGSERVLSGVLYLNDGYEGGELYFSHQNVTYTPKAGSIILFPSNFIYVHQSLPVKVGKKYICVSWFN